MDYEAALTEIGRFGRWQKGTLILLWLPTVLSGMTFMSYSFIFASPGNFRCFVPGCDPENREDVREMYPDWAADVIPPDTMGGYSRCSMQDVDFEQCLNNGSVRESVLIWNKENITSCQIHVYDQTVFEATAVTEFDLVCSRHHLKSLLGMSWTFAMAVGTSLIGFVADKLGRKKSTLLFLLANISLRVVMAFSHNSYIFAAAFIAQGVVHFGPYYTPLVHAVELMGREYSAVCGILINIPFVLGELLLILVAYSVRDFRLMLKMAFLPTYLFALAHFLLPESPRWLLAKGRLAEVKEIVRRGAIINGRSISEETLNSLQVCQTDRCDMTTDKYKASPRDIWYNPCMRKRWLIMSVQYLTVVICFLGLTLNSVNLAGSIHLNMSLGVLAEIPAYLACLPIIDRFGRRPVLISSQCLAGLSCLAVFLLPDQWEWRHWAVVALTTLSKFGASVAFTVVILMAAELFPTRVRATALSLCSSLGRFGGVLAPLLANLGPALRTTVPLAVFGTAGLAAGLLATLLPETAGKKLPASLAEAEEDDDAPRLRDWLRGRCCRAPPPTAATRK